MRFLIPILILALLVLHQDYWNWDNARLWFGFLPQSLAWHVVVSLLAACTWWVTVQFCWPVESHGQDSDQRSH